MRVVRFACTAVTAAWLCTGVGVASATEGHGLKSGSRALLYSLVGTVVPVGASIAVAASNDEGASDAGAAAVFCGGLIAGPSLGHFYAGRPRRALVGVGIRSACVLGMAWAVGSSLADFSDENDDRNASIAAVSLLLGAGSAIYDIARAPHSARIHNEKREEGERIGFTPALIGRERAPGLRVDARF